MVKVQMTGIATRVYEETRGGYTRNYVVVKEAGGSEKWPNVIRFRTKNGQNAPCAEGDGVEITAYVDGREWTPPEGNEPRYFTDFTIAECKVTVPAGGAGAKSPKNAVIAAWTQRNGNDMNALGEFCRSIVPGKASKDYTDADWNAVKAAIENPGGGKEEDDFDDLPF